MNTQNQTIEILDTTLRDGAQGEGITFSPEDKLNIIAQLDKLGVAYIEAGNPGSNPKEMAFFLQAKGLKLFHSKLVAFGPTRRTHTPVEEDSGCKALLEAGTPVVSIFGKGWDLHVKEVLCTTEEENLAMIGDTVAYMKAAGKEVLFDVEHFFDGWAANPQYAMRTVKAAIDAGADCVVLCDTNGGCFPPVICEATRQVADLAGTVKVGIHCHNDVDCAVANSLMAVEAGAVHVQGTFLGIGERCGNANLSAIIPNLQLKQGYACIPPEKMERLTKTARYLAEVANVIIPGNRPYVGKSAFAHKGGMHVDGVYKTPLSFEHIDPAAVGNNRNILLSEISGRTAVARRISAIDPSLTKGSAETKEFVEKLKEREGEGYQYESASASLEIFALKHLGRYKPAFDLLYFKIIGEQPAIYVERSSSAIVKVQVGSEIKMSAAEGEGPVHALDLALRRSLTAFYPAVRHVRLIDFKVRVMDGSAATAAKVRVLIVSTDGEEVWTTVGVSADIIDASWQALRDSIEYKLLRDEQNKQDGNLTSAP